jgi:hypothetical protein
MAMKKFSVGIGEREIQGIKVDAAREVEAEHFTIETSGAATFWKTIVKGQSSALILALAPGQWTIIELISQEDT